MEKIDTQIQKKALKIIRIAEGNICNRCLGRNFFQDIEANGNLERGKYIRQSLAEDLSRNSANFKTDSSCYVCDKIFETLENGLMNEILKKIEDSGIEFSTFLVGSRVPEKTIQREEIIHQELYSEMESIKKEINREIGKVITHKLGKEADFENPNVVFMMDFVSEKLKIQTNPLFIEGRYRKLVRGIPQTKWPCKKCKGLGCEKCNYSGKMYSESVEELISPPAVEKIKGSGSKFHGAGREDIDVKMLGSGRPFVLEIKEPQIRNPDLKELEKNINEYARGKVEVSPLKMASKDRRSQIKSSSTSTYKIYRALVELEEETTTDDLKIINSMQKIKQRTPVRVSHRRADKTRSRVIKKINVKKLDGKLLELTIECEGGLYIKELISGDNERTQPNISSLLSIPARCLKLDVMDVHQ